MAFNWQSFKTRTLTAAIFVVVMLAGLLINRWTFFVLFSVIHFGCWWEYQRLIGLIDTSYQKIIRFHKYAVMVIGWCIMVLLANSSFYIIIYNADKFQTWLAIILVLLVLLPLPLVLAITKKPQNILYSFLGLLYISLSLGLIMNMAFYEFGSWGKIPTYIHFFLTVPFAVLIIACMWINDTMAYIIGSIFGKTSLSKISPQKTWEGTIGGIVVCVIIVGLLLQYVINFPDKIKIGSYHYFILPGIASIAGVFGDLLESKLKRMAGVKDSGHIMPGHGGFLDRFDSLLIATPVVWLYVYFFMK